MRPIKKNKIGMKSSAWIFSLLITGNIYKYILLHSQHT